jgi:predicted permease
VQTFLQDVRYGIRILIKSPTFSIFAVLMLAVGIGINTAFFSLVNSLLLRPLPVNNPSQLTIIHLKQADGHFTPGLSYPDFQDVSAQTQDSFSGLLAYAIGLDALSRKEGADRILTTYVTGNYFDVLGVKPELGRLILPSEGKTRGSDPVLVLGYSYWQSRFGGDRSIIGKTVLVDGHEITIVGVAPKDFHGLLPPLDMEGYIPISMTSIGSFPPEFLTSRRMRYFSVVGRLNPNTSLKDTQAKLDVVANRLAAEYPKDNTGTTFHVYREPEARAGPPPNLAIELSGLFFALAILVLVLAALNLMNLLLVRITVREREMGIRAALGSSRQRLVRQLITENLVLSLIGAVAGIPLGLWAGSRMNSIDFFGYGDAPTYQASSLDWRVLLFSFAAACLTGVLVAIVPAWRVSHVKGQAPPVGQSSL